MIERKILLRNQQLSLLQFVDDVKSVNLIHDVDMADILVKSLHRKVVETLDQRSCGVSRCSEAAQLYIVNAIS